MKTDLELAKKLYEAYQGDNSDAMYKWHEIANEAQQDWLAVARAARQELAQEQPKAERKFVQVATCAVKRPITNDILTVTTALTNDGEIYEHCAIDDDSCGWKQLPPCPQDDATKD